MHAARRGGHTKFPPCRPALFQEPRRQRLEPFQQRERHVEQPLAVLRQLAGTATHLQQLRADQSLQRLHLFPDGRLGESEPAGRRRLAAGPGDFAKDLQQRQCQMLVRHADGGRLHSIGHAGLSIYQ